MSDDFTIHSAPGQTTDRISMINDYLNAVSEEVKVEHPTVTTAGDHGGITESLTDAPGHIDLSGFKVSSEPSTVTSDETVEHQGNESSVDTGDNDHDGVPNYLDSKSGDDEAAIDSDHDGITDDVDVTGSATSVKQPHGNENASADRVRSALISAMMTLLQFDFSLALGGADPSENEANKIGSLAQTSLGITSTRDARVADIDNSRNVSQEMRQYKTRTNMAKRKGLENTVLTGVKPMPIVSKTRIKTLSKALLLSPDVVISKNATLQDQTVKRQIMI
jgi:hypothetical protein